ncbi:MAG: transglutaminase-like domain-containing protein, partial [Candidatus Binatia bacterium]
SPRDRGHGRSAGIPSRIVAGTVYMPPEDGAAGAFFYHACVEVWLGRWTAVDPTSGQFPADATHVKLLEGGPEKHAGLLGLIGRLGIQVEGFG